MLGKPAVPLHPAATRDQVVSRLFGQALVKNVVHSSPRSVLMRSMSRCFRLATASVGGVVVAPRLYETPPDRARRQTSHRSQVVRRASCRAHCAYPAHQFQSVWRGAGGGSEVGRAHGNGKEGANNSNRFIHGLCPFHQSLIGSLDRALHDANVPKATSGTLYSVLSRLLMVKSRVVRNRPFFCGADWGLEDVAGRFEAPATTVFSLTLQIERCAPPTGDTYESGLPKRAQFHHMKDGTRRTGKSSAPNFRVSWRCVQADQGSPCCLRAIAEALRSRLTSLQTATLAHKTER